MSGEGLLKLTGFALHANATRTFLPSPNGYLDIQQISKMCPESHEYNYRSASVIIDLPNGSRYDTHQGYNAPTIPGQVKANYAIKASLTIGTPDKILFDFTVQLTELVNKRVTLYAAPSYSASPFQSFADLWSCEARCIEAGGGWEGGMFDDRTWYKMSLTFDCITNWSAATNYSLG